MAAMRALRGARRASHACVAHAARASKRKKKREDDRDELSRDPRRDIANRMRLSRYESAIRRWVVALNERGARISVEAAVHPEVRVARFGFGENAGSLMQSIEGTSGVTEWFGISPKVVQFEIAGPVEFESVEPSRSSGPEGVEATGEGSIASVRYRVSAPGFSNGGTWRFTLANDDLINWLEHHPDDLPNAKQEGGPRTGKNGEHDHDDPHHVEHRH